MSLVVSLRDRSFWKNGFFRGLIALSMIAGCWQLGQAGYMLAKARLAQHLLNHAWGNIQEGAVAEKPWPWADTYPLIKLRFPAADESMIVLSGASGRNLAFAPAHVSASAMPGETGVSVIGGHRDTHFSLLQRVNLRDELIVELPTGQQILYNVTQASVVDSRLTRLALDAERPMLALVACYPFNGISAGGPLRFVVMAEAVMGEAFVEERALISRITL